MKRNPGRALVAPEFSLEAHSAAHLPRILVYTSQATLVTTASTPIYPPRGGRIVAIHANVAAAPTSDMTIDVLIAGESILNSDYVTILSGEVTTSFASSAMLFDPRIADSNLGSFKAFEKLQVQVVSISAATGPLVMQLEIDWAD